MLGEGNGTVLFLALIKLTPMATSVPFIMYIRGMHIISVVYIQYVRLCIEICGQQGYGANVSWCMLVTV